MSNITLFFSDYDPSVSPDGTRVVFVSNRDGHREIYSMDINGGDVQRLTFDAVWVADPSFSPDGSKIIFTTDRYGNGNPEIAMMDAATGLNVTRLTNSAGIDETPTFSPEGRRIAFTSDRGGKEEIWTMDWQGELAGATPRVLTDAAGTSERHTHPTYSPDGTLLAYVQHFPGFARVRVIDADIGGPYLGGLEGGMELFPNWASAPRFSGLSGSTVTVLGTAGHDTITIGSNEPTGEVTFTRNGVTEGYPLDLVTELHIFMGDGNDVLDGQSSPVKFYASGEAGDDVMIGGPFNDTLTGGPGRNRLFGGDGDDRLNGSGGRDFLYGEAGNDRIYGNGGNDYILGGAHTDRIWGGDGDDFISGNGGNDKLYGEAGNDTIYGGDGNDLIYGGPGADFIHGQNGFDGAVVDEEDEFYSIESL